MTAKHVRNAAVAAEYNKLYRDRLLAEALISLGGRCIVCGSTDDLQFDHVDPATKVDAVSQLWNNQAAFWVEVAKCQLLCYQHHCEKTRRDNGWNSSKTHGTTACYRRGCKCASCRDAAASYARGLRHRKRLQREAAVSS